MNTGTRTRPARTRRDRPTVRRPKTPRIRRRAIVVLSVLTVVALVYLLFFSSLLGARSVEISGLERLSKDKVTRLAEVPPDEPLLRFDTGAAEGRIASLPEVEKVVVGRSLPSTITIEVTERRPLAFARTPDGGRLVDRTGMPFHQVGKKPKRLPMLRIAEPAPDDPATRAAMTVLAGLPAELGKKVRGVGAETPGDVQLTLKGDRQVHWGSVEQANRKAEVLKALLSRPGEVYDVSSPELPTVR